MVRRRTASRSRLGGRWRRIRRLPWTVLAILVGAAVLSSLAGLRDPEQRMPTLWLNLGTELAGAVVTYVLIDLVLGTRQRRQALIEQMGSAVQDVALAAAEELRRQGWLTDGSLQGALLSSARLEGAYLGRANLRHARLESAHLEGARLERANLKDAILEGAHLRGARLERGHLAGATLRRADLEGASLAYADLAGANLEEARLAEADMRSANLEDASLWSANLARTDLRRANLKRAELWGANLERADLRKADLTGANLVGANLRGSTVTAGQISQAGSLAGATLPNGRELKEDDR